MCEKYGQGLNTVRKSFIDNAHQVYYLLVFEKLLLQTDEQFYVIDTELDHMITRGFDGAFATGVVCQQGALTPPDTWSRPILYLHMFYLLRPILFLKLSLLSGLCFSNIHRYFLDLLLTVQPNSILRA